MDIVLRSTFLYLFILVVLRLTGKRTIGELSPFDLILLLLIAESTDNSIIGPDHSVISTVIAIMTFLSLELIMSFLKQKYTFMEKLLEGIPLIIAKNGTMIKDRSEKEKIDESDVMQSARQSNGIKKMKDVGYAVLEKNGTISVIPK